MFANIAWNETVSLGHARKGYRSAWEMIEAENPELWSEFKSNDVDAMIDELVQFKKQHYPDDQRRILGIKLRDGRTVGAEAVIITTGTFLNGLAHVGQMTADGQPGPALSLEEIYLKLTAA